MKRVVIALALAAGVAHADAPGPIVVHVTERAGDLAFLDAGDEQGVHANARVQIGDQVYPVVEVNAKTAAIRVPVDVALAPNVGGLVARAPAPAKPALADYTDQWPTLVPPARGRTVTAVPLDATSAKPFELAMIAHLFGTHGQGETHGDGELRVVGSFAVTRALPLAVDFDVSGRAYDAGYGGGRSPVLARSLALRYGADPRSPALALGRLHFAAQTLGILDGGRAALHVGAFEVAAFGGLVPDPISGKPDTSASRFGGEVIYRDDRSNARPQLAIVAHGSTWDGKLDERRLDATASMVLGDAWLDAWIETQQFANDNPFGAKAFEVVGAGASTEWRRSDAHVGADVTYLVPERSLRIAALIPDWLCTQPATGTARCTGDDRIFATTVSGGLSGARWSLDGAASFTADHGLATSIGGSGYVRGEVRRGIWSTHATASGGRVGFGDWLSAEAGVAIAPSRAFDAGLAYRPERIDETGGPSAIVHSIVADGQLAITRTLDLGFYVLASVGPQRDVLAALTTLAWRPTK